MLDLNTFKIVVDNTPLISIDFIIKNSDSKILLGKRVNKPAKDYLFTLGGRVYKNEKLNDAKQRILKEEVGLDIKNYNPKAQHNSYNWLSLDELMSSREVHKYVKDYFSKLGENK